jgi:hypothetical protein
MEIIHWKSKLKQYWSVFRPIVVYGCETWVLKESIIQRLLVLERKILRKIFGPTKEDNGTWRMKTNKELHELTFIVLMWRIGRAPNSIPIYSYIQRYATSHSLFISGNYSTCFEWYFHPSSGAHTTVSTASGICHTVTAICLYRGRGGTGLSMLWVVYATHSTLKPVPTLPR